MFEREFSTIEWAFDEETGIGRVTLDRPDSLNAMSDQLINDLIAGFCAFDEVNAEHDGVAVRAIIIEGAGDKAFCVGGDVAEIQEQGSDAFPGASGQGNALMDTIEDAAPPVIAKIDGYCLGGGLEIALSCDFRFASERSTFGFPEINLGIFPGSSGTQRLATHVPPNRAKEILMTGDEYSADVFAEEGIIDEAVPAEDLEETVINFADRISDRAPLAIQAIKDVVDNAREVGPRQGARYVTKSYLPLLKTEDHKRALKAAFEDRNIEFQGK